MESLIWWVQLLVILLSICVTAYLVLPLVVVLALAVTYVLSSVLLFVMKQFVKLRRWSGRRRQRGGNFSP